MPTSSFYSPKDKPRCDSTKIHWRQGDPMSLLSFTYKGVMGKNVKDLKVAT